MTQLALRLLPLLLLASTSRADCVIAWPPGAATNNTWGMGHVNSNPSFAFEREVADDFDYSGNIARVYVDGYNGGPTGSPTPIDGVWVRFYEWTAGGPGVLQAAFFVAGNDPRVGFEPRPSGVEVGLATPFVATGKHFVSVQVDFTDYGSWEPWQSNFGAPRLSTGWVRTNAGAWGLYTPLFQTQPLMADVAIMLYTDPSVQCAQWNAVAVPSPGSDSGLVDVEVLSATEVWALGNNNVTAGVTLNSYPFALRLSGGAWNLVQLPPAPTLGTAGSRTTMEALEVVAPNDIWAAGAHRVVVPGGWVGHQIRADHYDGSSWTTMSTPLPQTSGSAGYSGARITDMASFGSNDVWFVGEWVGPYPGALGSQPALAMRWDGNSFALVPTPEVLPNGGNGLQAIDGRAANDVWAVGGGGDGDLASYSYILHWDGSNWAHVPGPTVGLMQRFHDVVAIAVDDVWAAGEAFGAAGYVGVLQRWDGTSWSNVSGAPTSFTPSLHAAAADDLWLGLWHYDGLGWAQERVAGCDPWASAGVLGGAAGRLFAVGSAQLPGRVPYALERTAICAPVSYCSSATTTHGCSPSISSQGNPSASAASGFTLRVEQLEGQRSGLIFYSQSGAQALPWGAGSTSFLCVKPPLQRMSAQQSGGTLGGCDGTFAVDWNAFMAARPGALGQPRAAGQVFDAQAWHRDPPAPKTTNLSNALEFTLAP